MNNLAGFYNFGSFHLINHNEIGYPSDISLVYIFYKKGHKVFDLR